MVEVSEKLSLHPNVWNATDRFWLMGHKDKKPNLLIGGGKHKILK